MRLSLLAAASLAGLALPLPAGAAGSCVATAGVPQPIDGQVMSAGSFTCSLPSPGMTVTVCVEVLQVAEKPVGFQARACDTATATGSVAFVSAAAFACVQGGPTLVRTTVTGANADGGTGAATSLPAMAPGAGSCGP